MARNNEDFVLAGKASDLWLYTADACANGKVIPKKYRYTMGTSLMNSAEVICGAIEEANLIDLREDSKTRMALQRKALRECKLLGRRIQRMAESDQYPGVTAKKAATWSKQELTVRYMCAAWYSKDQQRVSKQDTRKR